VGRGGQLGLALKLAVLALGLAGVLAWKETRSAVPAGEVPVIHVTIGDVRAVAAPGWSLRRVDGGWRVTGEGTDGPADEAAVGRLLGALAHAGHGVPVDGPDATFGLDAPATLVIEAGGEPVRLEVGAAAAVGDRTYVRVPGGGVVAVHAPLARLARAPASAWVEDRAESPQDADGAPTGSRRR
jgi:hypothetical protein